MVWEDKSQSGVKRAGGAAREGRRRRPRAPGRPSAAPSNRYYLPERYEYIGDMAEWRYAGHTHARCSN